MSKQDSSSGDEKKDEKDKDEDKEVVVVDTEDAVQFGADAQLVDETLEDPVIGAARVDEEPLPRKRPWFGLFNLLLVVALAAAGGWYWWQQQQLEQQYRAAIAELEAELATRASNSRLDASLAPLKSGLEQLGGRLDQLGAGQQDLREASEKLYELYGRDKNDWQLAEVEYLMRIAQHQLVLQHDFEGAAVTLQAANDLIGRTGDPGLLPVRVKISEEIAELKTRQRPDLVGTTLILAQLARQAQTLQAGFALRIDAPPPPPSQAPVDESWIDKIERYIDALITISYRPDAEPSEVEANIVNVGETLEDNLKLARWSVLERDAVQYRRLIDETARLFQEFYDLDNAANNDFFKQLRELQQVQIRPELPDIGGSLRELQRILSQRENAPAEPLPGDTANTESADG